MKQTKIKDILKKQLISICIVVMLSCTVFTNYVHAGAGGVLLSPIIDFTAFIGDTILFLIQETILGMSDEMSADTAEDDFMMHNWDDDAMAPFKGTSHGGTEFKIGGEYIDDSQMDHGFFGFLSYKYPTIYISPAEIFAGKVEMFDIDFISGTGDSDSRVPTKALHDTISQWYATLRNFALAGMLCVLIYIGIRIIISSTANDSSKYKSLLTNWIVAMCLLFFIHYMILLMVTISKEITRIFSVATDSSNYVIVKVKNGDAAGGFTTNQIGLARFLVQYNKLSVRTAYLLIYVALVGFTFYYSFIYIKRTLMMALLTLSAPIICFMYPIDKIGDGSAQTFKSWFNEVLYTCLLQPFHLLIYTIFVSSATNLAMNNPLYSVAVLFFMIPAEKFFKDMLGFSKRAPKVGASPAVAGALGGLMAGQAKKMLMGGGSSKKDKSGGGSEGGSDNGKVRENTNKTASDKNEKDNKDKQDPAPNRRALKELLNMNDEDAYESFYKGDKKSHKEYRQFRRSLAWDAAKESVGGAVDKTLDVIGKVPEFLSETDEAKQKREKNLFMAQRKASRAVRNTASKVIKATPKTMLKAGGRVYGAYAGTVLGAGYAALKGDADPSQEMLGGAVGGLLVGGKLADSLTPSVVANVQANSKVDLSGVDFKKIGKQIEDEVATAMSGVNMTPKLDTSSLENALNSTLGGGYTVDKMGLNSIVNSLNNSGQLDGSANDINTITNALMSQSNGLQLHTATGDIDFSAKINTAALAQQLKDSLGNFEIEKISVGDMDLTDVKTKLDDQLKTSGKAYLEVDDEKLKQSLSDISFKPGADMSEVRKQFVNQVKETETKLKMPEN